MLQEKEMTTLNPSVAADGEQSLTNHNNSITDDAPCVNEDSVNLENDEQYDFEAEQREMWKRMDPNYLKTVSMPELYDTVYPSRSPVIDGLLYPGTYILAGAPKLSAGTSTRSYFSAFWQKATESSSRAFGKI